MHTTKFKIDYGPLTSCKPTNLSRTIFLPKEAGSKLQDFYWCGFLIGIILIMPPPHLHKINYRTPQNYLTVISPRWVYLKPKTWSLITSNIQIGSHKMFILATYPQSNNPILQRINFPVDHCFKTVTTKPMPTHYTGSPAKPNNRTDPFQSDH